MARRVGALDVLPSLDRVGAKPLVLENITAEEPERRQDVHNLGVDTELAAARRCGQTDLRTGWICTKAARHDETCEFLPKDAARASRTTPPRSAHPRPGPPTPSGYGPDEEPH
jgi:hypothetical protein